MIVAEFEVGSSIDAVQSYVGLENGREAICKTGNRRLTDRFG